MMFSGNQGGLATLTVSSRFWKTAEDDNIVLVLGYFLIFRERKGILKKRRAVERREGYLHFSPSSEILCSCSRHRRFLDKPSLARLPHKNLHFTRISVFSIYI
jgi:hypothetical protein